MLPHDLQYCLDGASDCGEITTAADIALRLYGEVAEMDRIWNEGPEERDASGELSSRRTVRRYVIDRRERSLGIERYAANIIGRLPPERRLALVTYGFASICRAIRMQAEWLANSFYEDSTKGGAMCDFLKNWKVGRDMMPTKKLARRLKSRARWRRYIDRFEGGEIAHVRKLVNILRAIPVTTAVFAESEEQREALQRELQGQLERTRIAARQAVESARWRDEYERRGRAGMLDPTQVDEVRVRLKPGVARKWRREKIARRKATKRGALMAAALLGASTVAAFAKGDPVRLDAGDLALSAQLAGALDASGHGALSIAIAAPSGKRLASLCLYQEAPALDQLCSLALHAQAGNVADVLAAGNLFNVQPGAEEHPLIAARWNPAQAIPLPVDPVDMGVGDVRHGFHPGNDRERYEVGKSIYVARMTPAFAEVVAEMVLGKAVKAWRRDSKALLALGDSDAGAFEDVAAQLDGTRELSYRFVAQV